MEPETTAVDIGTPAERTLIARVKYKFTAPESCAREREDLLRTISGNDYLALQGLELKAVAGTGSMLPMLTKDTTLIVKPYSGEKLCVHDIIIFNSSTCRNLPSAYGRPDASTVHRIIEVKKDGYITQGDNNANPDECLVEGEDILNRVVAVIMQ